MNKTITGYRITLKTDAYANVDLRAIGKRVAVDIPGKRAAIITMPASNPYERSGLVLLEVLSSLEIKAGSIDMHNIRHEHGLVNECVTNAAKLLIKYGNGRKVRTTTLLNKCGVCIRLELTFGD